MEARQLEKNFEQPNNEGPNLNVVPKSQFEPGGVGSRLVARFIDGIIVGVASLPVSMGLGMILAFAPDLQTNLAVQIFNQIISYAISYVYFAFFYAKSGATPGKKLMKLKVENIKTGTNPSWGCSAKRELLGTLLCLFSFGIGYLMAIFNSEKKGLHDMVAGTRVVKRVN